MNYLKPSLIRGIPLIALLVASTLSATIVKTATVLPPCQEQSAEYNWQLEVVYVRASSADCQLRRVLGQEGFRLPAGARSTVIGQRGGKDAWEKSWEVWVDATATDLLQIVDAKLSEGWTRIISDTDSEGATSIWAFTDEGGRQWNAIAGVEPVRRGSHRFRLSIKLARTDSVDKAQTF